MAEPTEPETFDRYHSATLSLLGRGFDKPVLDFGCGIGELTRLLAQSFPTVHGYDPSAENVKLARTRTPSAVFFDDPETLPGGHYGAIVLAHVVRYVPPANRPGLMRMLFDKSAAGGWIIAFENNPENPLVRRAGPLDEGAGLLGASDLRALLRKAGFKSTARAYVGFFPRALSRLWPLEKRLTWLPLGREVCVSGRKG
jgi:SAM-dependent methyltransferase